MTNINRISWDEYFLKMCDVIKLRSVDANTKVGCVIVDQCHRIVSTGYNSFPAGIIDGSWPNERNDKYYIYDFDGTPTIQPYKMNEEEFMPYPLPPTIGIVTKYDVMTHAELNAVVAAGRNLAGCTLYCTYIPCNNCAMAIITAGITKVIASQELNGWNVQSIIAKKLFSEANVELQVYQQEV